MVKKKKNNTATFSDGYHIQEDDNISSDISITKVRDQTIFFFRESRTMGNSKDFILL